MFQPFTCSVCGMRIRRRSYFYWVAGVVAFLNGQFPPVDDGPVCVRCAPSWATALGRFLYVLVAICLALLVWRFASFLGNRDVTPNPSIQSGRAGSVVPHGTSQRPAADFER